MAVEIELKLSLGPEYLDRLRQHPLCKSKRGSRAATRRLYNIYYDTPAHDLHRNAMALRLRRVGRNWLQTLKGGGSVDAGLHQRNEWEMPVPGKALDIGLLTAAGVRLPRGTGERLQPVFVTDFERTTRLVEFDGAEIEMCVDSGEIKAGARELPISELELELKSGVPRQLFVFALALLDSVPLAVEQVSKAEHGYQLVRSATPDAVKASFPELSAQQDIASALRNMTAACLQHVQANVPGAIRSRDEEFLHQVRVGLRRLRVVLGMAERFHPDAELDELHEQVAQMCVEFGGLREWDVFTTQTLPSIRSREPDHAGMEELEVASEQQRTRHREEVVSKLQSTGYQRFLLRFGAWMFSDYWQQASIGSGATLAEFAVINLDKRRKQVHKLGRAIASADPEQLHRLRIACKKLRYSAEMFGALFDAGRVKPYTSALSRLQDIMGVLNDLVVARRLFGELSSVVRYEAQERLHTWMELDRLELMTQLAEAWPQFAERREFWK